MNAASPAAVVTLPDPNAQSRLRDFSDRLSPMLVKELRQGLRSPLFVWGMIAMNLFLAMVVWLTTEDPTEESLHQAFFGGYCVLVCGLLPLRGANALFDELRGNTIDTLVLTRLTGWRITLGKWVAVGAQQVLATVTVLPYLIVRYFAGGLNVPMELAWLGIFLLVGLCAAAVLTGFSWIKYFLLRSALMLGIVVAAGAFCAVVLEEIYGGSREYLLDEMYKATGWRLFAILAVAVPHLMFMALDIGAAQVGSITENRSARRRLVGLGVILLYCGIAFSNSSGISFRGGHRDVVLAGIFASGITAFLISLQSLVEKPVNLSPVLQPFVRKGIIGRLAGRFFYPGWPSGVMFTLGIIVFVASILTFYSWDLYWKSRSYRAPMVDISMRFWSKTICGYGAVLFMLPVPLMVYQLIFKKRMSWHLGTYILMLTLLLGIELVLIALASGLEKPDLLKLGLPIPTMGWAWLAHIYPDWNASLILDRSGYIDWNRELIIKITAAVGIFWWAVALIVALRAFRPTSAVEKELILELKAAKELAEAEKLPAAA